MKILHAFDEANECPEPNAWRHVTGEPGHLDPCPALSSILSRRVSSIAAI
jgi:hypothetical protein